MPHIRSNFISYTLRRAVTADLILPGLTSTEADSPAPSHRPKYPYPLLYLLHGYWNDYSCWERYTSLERYAEERNIAVVTFSSENNFSLDLSSLKKPNAFSDLLFDPDYAAFVTRELPEFITSTFPVSDRPEDTFIAGLSMGGFGAMSCGFANPSLYRAVGAFSPLPCLYDGYYEGEKLPGELTGSDPLSLIKKDLEAGGAPDLYLSYGEEDFLFEKQEHFRKEIESLPFKKTVKVLPSFGHEWAFWDRELVSFLDWIPRSDPAYLSCPIRKI